MTGDMAGDKMMIVVVNVVLGGTGLRLSSDIAGHRPVGDSAPDTEASVRRQGASASRAGVAHFVRVTGRRQVLRSRASRHALDGFHRRGHGLGIRLRPAEGAGEPLKQIFEFLALNGLVLLWIGLWIGTIRIVCGHGNLIADIVGEFVR